MTIAEVLAAVAAAVATLFGDDTWAVWPQPPDATALPAVWPELAQTFTAGTTATVGVRVVAAIAPQVTGAEYARLTDAADRLETLRASSLGGVAIQNRSGIVGEVEIGAVPHTALLYTLTLDRPLPC